MNIPILSDFTKKIATDYGVLKEDDGMLEPTRRYLPETAQKAKVFSDLYIKVADNASTVSSIQ
jgi:alkyl hydroperoxide reductase subunit AhpC